MHRMRMTALGLGLAATSSSVLAQDFGLPAPAQVNSGDVAWVAIASLGGVAAMVGAYRVHARGLTMRPLGLALAGLALLWCAIGYSLAFGVSGGLIGDGSRLFLSGLNEIAADTSLPESSVVLFELTLAGVATALVAAAAAVRTNRRRPTAFVLLWLLIAYVPLCHWMRSGGWLAGLGVLDFAGGVVVHVASALAAFVLLRGDEGNRPEVDEDASGSALLLLGSAVLIAGAGYAADDLTGTALLNVALAVAAGTLVWAGMGRLRGTHTATLPGAIAALAAISASAGFVGGGGAVATGLIASLVAYVATLALRARGYSGTGASIVALHGAGGATGALLVGLLAFPQLGGPGFESPVSLPSQLAAQTIGVVVTALWSAAVSLGLLWLLSLRWRRRRKG